MLHGIRLHWIESHVIEYQWGTMIYNSTVILAAARRQKLVNRGQMYSPRYTMASWRHVVCIDSLAQKKDINELHMLTKSEFHSAG
jgi:hypothetical protein